MKSQILFFLVSLCISINFSLGQGIGINDSGDPADASAMLDVQSTSKGILIPRMTASQINAISSPETGLMVYQTDTPSGFYYYQGSSWIRVGNGDFIDGGEATGTNRSLGNKDNFDLSLLTNNSERMTIKGNGNIGIGEQNPGSKLDIIHNSESENTLYASQMGNGNAATFDIPSSTSTGHSLNVYNGGSGYGLDLVIQSTGTGPGGRFSIDNSTNEQPAIYGEHNGLGNAGMFLLNNSSNNNAGIFVRTNGIANAGHFKTENLSNNYATIYAEHIGLGSAGYFKINNAASNKTALYGNTNGSGAAFGGRCDGDGIGGFALINNTSNTNNAFEATTKGMGSAARFEIDNGSSLDPVVEITGSGTGYSLSADGTIDIRGFYMNVGPTLGYVLTTDASGTGTWQASQFEFSDGGEAADKNRVLGNTDNHSFSLITNDFERIHISSDGMVGIGTTNPSGILDIAGAYHFPPADGTIGQVLKTDGGGTLSWSDDNLLSIQEIDDLNDGKTGGKSTFLGTNSGASDNGSNSYNTAVGEESFSTNVSGAHNTAIGYSALKNSIGSGNSSLGYNALLSNSSGSSNTAVGANSLDANTIGGSNTAIGFNALSANSIAYGNTAAGTEAMWKTSSGSYNVAVGGSSLRENISGQYNTAIGYQALNKNVASNNTGLGHKALNSNTNGIENTAVGDNCLQSNYASKNSALGVHALSGNLSGTGNVGIGYRVNNNNQHGNYNTIIGYEAGYGPPSHDKSYCVMIGYQAGYNESSDNKLYIENSNSSSPLIYGDFSTDKVTINDVLKLTPRASAPTSPVAGEIYVGTDGHIYCYLGSIWKQLDN